MRRLAVFLFSLRKTNTLMSMPRSKKTKSSFNYDDQGRVILGSAKEMAAWVKLGFVQQEKNRTPEDEIILKNFIDLRKCVLYISYPVGDKTAPNKIFNFCELAGIVPGIEKIKGDPNYLFEVKQDIRFDGSVLYGNFFHYVKFNGVVDLDDVTINGSFSGFRCQFDSYVYMQRLHVETRCDFEQCIFAKGLIMNGANAHLFHYNNCIIRDRLWLSSVSLNNQHHEGYYQSIGITNSTVENFKLSRVDTDGLPVYLGNSKVDGMQIDNVSLDNVLSLNSCTMEGIMTMLKGNNAPNNRIKEIVFHICDVEAQCHIENSEIDRFSFDFGKISEKGRIRFSQCDVGDLVIGSSSIFGQVDIIESKISILNFDETQIPGYLNFQKNTVDNYPNRQTLRILKNEALKVNDDVEALKHYAKEMNLLLADNDISLWDKLSLRFNKCFSRFGENWIQALLVTLGLSIAMTLLMLGLGSSKYAFNLSGKFIGIGGFVTALLDSINVFSIPLFRDTIEEYGLNVWGQILYFVIKLVVAYGTYQVVVAFRKYGRK